MWWADGWGWGVGRTRIADSCFKGLECRACFSHASRRVGGYEFHRIAFFAGENVSMEICVLSQMGEIGRDDGSGLQNFPYQTTSSQTECVVLNTTTIERQRSRSQN